VAADTFGHIDAVRSNRPMQINSIARRWCLRGACATATVVALSACANEPTAVALRAVKLEQIRNADGLHRPYYWAPFQLYAR
jgi:hypothetical protein